MTPKDAQIALVTGATGFVGSHLVRRLLRDGWRVHVVVRSDAGLERLHEARMRVTVHCHDGTDAGMRALVAAARPNTVFHLASLFLSEHHPDDVTPLLQSNLIFGTQLLEAMRHAGVTRLINTGTSWQHYQDCAYSPVNLYAATKQAFEALLQYYVEACGLTAVTLKLFDTYGPDDPRPKLMHMLKRLAETGESLAMSPGEQHLDLVHIDDVVAAFCCAARHLKELGGGIQECYAVSSGQPVALRELVACFGRVVGTELSIQWGGRPYREREVMVPWSQGRPVPGWQPTITFSQGVAAMMEDTHEKTDG